MAYSGDSHVQTSGAVPAEQEVVSIDSDVQPVWETEALPDWVVYWLIPMLAAGQRWPGASESGLSALAHAYAGLSDGSTKSVEPAGSAARTIVTGWSAPATADFVTRARRLYGAEGGITGVSRNARAYAQQVNGFAVETQYSKLSINVAFWVTVIAIAIALIVAFFSAGASTALIGPYAAAARTAISRILVRLATIAGREIGAARLARVAALSGATGRGALVRLLASPIGKELIEEIGEEFTIAYKAQQQQIEMGTRKELDWKMLAATALGAGGGAVTGTVVAGPVSRVNRVVPGFTGRALTTGLTNVIASPVGSLLGNGLVYGQWQNPFTAESMTGAFLGGVGRTGSISPFNPDVATALAHPLTTLASAYDAAARADEARAAGPSTGPSAGPSTGPVPTGGGPSGPDSNQPGARRSPDLVTVPSPGPSTTPAAGNQSPGAGQPDTDVSTRRRSTSPDQPAVTPAPDETPDRRPGTDTRPDTAPRADTDTTPERRPATTDTPARQEEGPDPAATLSDTDAAPVQNDGQNVGQDVGQDEQDPAAVHPPADPAAQQSPGNSDESSAAQDDTAQDDTAQDDTAQDDTAQDDTAQDDTAQDDTAQDDTARDDESATREEAHPDDNTAPGPSDDHAPADQPSQIANAPSGRSDADPDGSMPAIPATVPAPLRARSALLDALDSTFPGALIGPTGEVIVPHGNGHRVLSSATMARLRSVLDIRAAVIDNYADLVVDASALVLIAVSDDRLSSDAPAGIAPPAAHTSQPGTVTSPPIPGTRYVTDSGRPTDVTLDELKQATAELLATYFQHAAETVLELFWSGDILVVRTANGTHHFRPVVGPRDQEMMGQTTLRAATIADPAAPAGPDTVELHEVSFPSRIATDQISRVWLHEITDTLQRLAAEQSSGRQGVLRRTRAAGDGRQTTDECVPGRRNELELLTDKWERASTLQEKYLLAGDIQGVLNDLRRRKVTPPLPPWATGPRAVRTSLEVGRPGPDLSAEAAQEIARRFADAEQALTRLRDDKKASAKEAGKQAREAAKEAKEAKGQKDSGAALRADTAEADAQSHRNRQGRHIRIAAAYEAALNEATKAREAYERYARVRAAAPHAPAPTQPGQMSMEATAAANLSEAGRTHDRYLEALAKALPDPFSMPEAMPTGRLAHLNVLTDRVNDALKEKEAPRRYTPDELENYIRADFHKVVSGDGLVLSTGWGKNAAEVRIRLTLSDLVEMIDPAVVASQATVGMFYQTGQTYSATKSGGTGTTVDLSSAPLTPLLQVGSTPRLLAEMFAVGVGASHGRSWSASSGSSMFEQGGSVADNRSESMLFDAKATWSVEVRTRKSNGWSAPVLVSSGDPGDTTTQRIWVWHSYVDQESRRTTTLDDVKQTLKVTNPEATRKRPVSNQEVISMTGLEAAFDELARKLGGEFARIGTNARRDLRKFVTQEVQARFGKTHTGLSAILAVKGEPDVRITATSRLVPGKTRMVGAATAEVLEEGVLTETATSSTSVEYGGSLGGKASVGINHDVLQGMDVLGPLGDYHPDVVRPEFEGRRPVSRSSSSSAGQVAVHPAVDKRTGLSQAYHKEAELTFTVERPGKKPVEVGPLTTELLVRMQVLDAFHAGDPVPVDALVLENGKPKLDADGNVVLSDSPRHARLPGRRIQRPHWLGDGTGQMRGAGPTDVREVAGLTGLAEEVLERLGRLGLVAKIVNGVPKYDSNPLVRAAQLLNEEQVRSHLVESAIRSAFDQLAQSGILIVLQLHGAFKASPDVYGLYLVVRQDFSGLDTPKGLVNKVRTHLEIASDSSGRGINQSKKLGAGASAVKTDGPPEHHDGITHKAGPNGGADWSYSAGTSTSSMVNNVDMEEDGQNKQTANLETTARLEVHLVHNGEIKELVDARTIKPLLMVPGDMLPRDGGPDFTGPMGRPTKKLMKRATLEHFDAGPALGDIKQIWKLLPRGLRGKVAPLAQLWPLLSRHFLASHLFAGRPVRRDLVLDPDGIAPARASLEVRGELGEARLVDVVDSVTGRIMLALRSVGISWGGSNNLALGLMNSLADSDDGGTTSDSGTLKLPSRSRVRAITTALVAIFGTEFLGISVARKYRFQVPVDVEVKLRTSRAVPTGHHAGGWKSRMLHSQGNGLFTVPEHDALRMYADGELSLPLPVLADAVERFLNGSTKLHRTLAVPLVMRYVKARGDALSRGENIGIGAGHTPAKLLEALKKVADLGDTFAPAVAAAAADPLTARSGLDNALSEAKDVNDRLKDVVVAPQYENGMGVSLPQAFDVTDGQGNPVNIMDVVLSAVDAAVPGAVRGTPNLRGQIANDLDNDQAEVHLDDIWSRRGLEREYTVHVGRESRAAKAVTVRVRMEPAPGTDPRKAVLVDQSDEDGIILQRYRAKEMSHTEAYSVSHSAGLDHGDSDSDGDNTGGLSTSRGRSYSSSNSENRMRLQRLARFKGLTTVEQDMRLVVEVVTGPAHVRPLPLERRLPRATGLVRAQFAKLVSALGKAKLATIRLWRRRPAVSLEYDVKLQRGIPSDMVRRADQDPGPVPGVIDPRRVELEPGHFPEALSEDMDRDALFDVVDAQLTRMTGHAATKERAGELSAWLSHSGLITGLERAAGRDGDVVPQTAEPKFRNQGVDVTLQARMSDLTVVAGPFDGEKGEVDRRADAQNVSVGRGHALPLGASGGTSFKALGVGFSKRYGAQSGQSAAAHQGARRERSMFETGKLYTVRVRVDYDLTFERVQRHRRGDVLPRKDVVHLPGKAGGTAMITIFGEELAELHARMEAGVRVAPPMDDLPRFTFRPKRGRSGLIQVLQDARVAARERGKVARVHVYEEGPDGRTVKRRYLATPDGLVLGDTDGGSRAEAVDGGFAEAFSTLPPHLLDAADRNDLNLREIFTDFLVPGTFTQKVAAELESRGALPPDPEPVWQVSDDESPGQPQGGSTSQPTVPQSVTDPELPGSPLDATARPEGVPDVTPAEVVGQDVSPSVFGGAVANIRANGDDRLVVQVPWGPDIHTVVRVGNPGERLLARTELHAGTEEDPHVLWMAPRVHPLMVSAVLVHELSHMVQVRAALLAGMPQGMVRGALSPLHEGTDHCLLPRLAEHDELSGKWRRTTDPAAKDLIAQAIQVLAADIARRGATPPPAPWHSSPPPGARPGTAASRAGAPSDTAGTTDIAGLPDAETLARLRGLIDGEPSAQGSIAAALGGITAGAPDANAVRAEAERAGLAPGQPGAAARIVALARAGELAPEHVTALRGSPALPETAAADAVARAVARMGARARTYGPGLLDIEIPGRPPIPVEIRAASQAGRPDEGLLTYQVDESRTIGANERAAASTAAAALAATLGLDPAGHAAVAGLYETVRQVRAATPAQLPARLGVLHDVASAVPRRLVPAALAADLAELLAGPRPGARHARWNRARSLANGTGWQPLERECECPPELPCRCGRREEAGTGRAVRA
ncbi:hypothetical protein [Nonomuraea sp. GTA35]|uniref:WXG100-like domain-containing protein n=1 Tax=Nonomuraea sp. GTA35 TaxID=1676746 RepID=UPI0035C0D92C